MASSLPLWLQRLPANLRRRLELIEASARESLAEVHAEQALQLVHVFASRMPFDQAVDEYLEMVGLDGDAEEMVRTRALALLSDPEWAGDLARERPRGSGFNWRYITPVGAVRFFQRRMRRQAEEELWMELFAARAEEVLTVAHMEQALRFVELLADDAPPPQGVELYLSRLQVPPGRARVVYQRVLAHLAETLLPRLLEPDARGRPERQGR
jgi:hypothetical protein